MQFRTTGLLLLGAMVLPTSGIAQTTPAPPAITRTVVAATKLPTVADVPLHFKAVSITLRPDEKMAKQSKTVHKKSRGRPAGKKYSETIPARLEPATLASLDAWAAANDMSRSE